MGVILILLQRNNKTLFKNKENLDVRLLLTFPGAAGKDSFFMLPERFLWFSGALAPSKNNVVMCPYCNQTLTWAPAVLAAVQTQSNQVVLVLRNLGSKEKGIRICGRLQVKTFLCPSSSSAIVRSK